MKEYIKGIGIWIILLILGFGAWKLLGLLDDINMDFTESTWFLWVCIIVVAGTLFAIFWSSFVEDGPELQWSVIWHYIKKITLIILGIFLTPFIIIFHFVLGSKTDKRKE